MTDANNTDKTTSAAAETAAETPAVEASTEAVEANAEAVEATTTAAVAVAEKPAAKAAGTTVTVGKLSAQELIRAFEAEQIAKQAKDLPDIYVGDTVRVGVRITEGNKERIQPYEGVVIAKRHGGLNETITVRRIFQGVGVERVFLLHSPQVASVKVERRGKVRRAKLFYLRDRVGKATRVKQRFDR
jgi:large subunit ribosomal protein L19